MAFRFFRRIKILPGVTANLSKSGMSTSLGPKGAKLTVGPRGIRKTVGLPGTGLYYTETSKKKKTSPETVERPTGRYKGLWCSLLLGIFFLALSGVGWVFTMIGIICLLYSGLTILTGVMSGRKTQIQEQNDIAPEHDRNENERQDLIEEQPSTPTPVVNSVTQENPEDLKKCAQCGELIKKDAKICRFCGHTFRVIYTLTVYKPEDERKGYLLSKKIADKTKRSLSEVNGLLNEGMLIRYSAINMLDKNRKAFESFGCRVIQGEIVSND